MSLEELNLLLKHYQLKAKHFRVSMNHTYGRHQGKSFYHEQFYNLYVQTLQDIEELEKFIQQYNTYHSIFIEEVLPC